MDISRHVGRSVALLASTAVVVGAAISAPAASSGATSSTARVIIAATSSAAGRLAAESVGGAVTRDLPLIDAVAATVPTAAVAGLAQAAGVLAVVPDEKVHVQAGPVTAEPVAPDGADTDYPPSVYRGSIKADKLERKTGAVGSGVTVALIDTGITMSPDLDGRVLKVRPSDLEPKASCVNLSGTPDCNDGYGHGTFMAGLIAGTGASREEYRGVAPGAKLVSIKVASNDGSADVSNVLAGIQWAVSYKRDYGIKVLNLSLGTDSRQPWDRSPLNWAVERAWDAGITVVVAASNLGPDAGSVAKPGDDPWVITVGAVDDQETQTISDDLLPDFSSRGPTLDGFHKPDLVAPGGRLVSLRAPGSYIDVRSPVLDDVYHRGSGTSMATAVVSGVAALVLSKNDFGPNRLKYVLTRTARPVAVDDVDAVGSGMVNAFDAAVHPPSGVANEGLGRAQPYGDLEPSRGNLHVAVARTGDLIEGDLTAQLLPLQNPFFYGKWNNLTWSTSQFARADWNRTIWPEGDNWEGDNWEGCTDEDGQYGGETCAYGDNWEGAAWYGAWG